MKLSALLLALTISAVPARAIAQTPNMDKGTDTIKEYLWKKGMNTAPTHIYLAARWAVQAEMCGSPNTDMDMVTFELRMASVEAPASVIESWFQIMKQKMTASLTLHPEETAAFCK